MGKLEGIRIITNKNVAREAKLPEGEQQISLIISKGVPYMNKGNLWGVGKLKGPVWIDSCSVFYVGTSALTT